MRTQTSTDWMMKVRQAYPELASIPVRSPETSIILAEFVRRQHAATEERRNNWLVIGFIRATAGVLRPLRKFIARDLAQPF
jgi:hypothetical protein